MVFAGSAYTTHIYAMVKQHVMSWLFFSNPRPPYAMQGNLSKLNSLVKNLGRNVKNTASIAYERIGASVSNNRIMDDELVYYSQLVSEVLCVVAALYTLHYSLSLFYTKRSLQNILSTPFLTP